MKSPTARIVPINLAFNDLRYPCHQSVKLESFGISPHLAAKREYNPPCQVRARLGNGLAALESPASFWFRLQTKPGFAVRKNSPRSKKIFGTE
jgi:hypothetical protein